MWDWVSSWIFIVHFGILFCLYPVLILKIGIFAYCYWLCRSYLYILDTLLLSGVVYFFPSQWIIFWLCLWCLLLAEIFNFDVVKYMFFLRFLLLGLIYDIYQEPHAIKILMFFLKHCVKIPYCISWMFCYSSSAYAGFSSFLSFMTWYFWSVMVIYFIECPSLWLFLMIKLGLCFLGKNIPHRGEVPFS